MAWMQFAIAGLLFVRAATADSSVFTSSSNYSLLWGPYKPNVYFGLRPRVPKSVFTGLLWTRVEDFQKSQQNIRYTCEQNEGMAGYGWDVYDPRTGGVQTIHDKANGLDLETSFVKMEDGKSWAARIKGSPREDAEPGVQAQGGTDQLKTSVWFTVAVEGLGSLTVDDAETAEEFGFDGDVSITGETGELGDFKLLITEPESNSHPVHAHPAYETKPLDRTFVHSLQTPEKALWQAKPLLFGSLRTTINDYVELYTAEKMPPPCQTYTIQNEPGSGNYHIIQKVFDGPFEFDVLFTPASSDLQVTSEELTKKISSVRKGFDEKYEKVHKPNPPFSNKDFLGFSQSLFSNLIGGIGHFYGDQVIDRSYAPEYDEDNEGFWTDAAEARSHNAHTQEGPYELFTSVPSRPFFPRGFLWDEGFHLIPMLEWDPELVMQILSSWFNAMDEDGWIAREMILGDEARSKVPQEFQVQYPHYANPPTLFIVLEAILAQVPASGTKSASQQALNAATVDADVVKSWLVQLYPLLQRNFNWYRKTQRGDLKSYDREAFSSREAYRWRGRTPQHILTSGLDDYPRAQPPHPGELHTDLISWMGMMARAMTGVAAYLGESDDEATYSEIAEAIRRNVDDLHWDSKEKTYCDATIDDYEESVHVCHKGYISIFPFMTGLLGPNHPHLGHVLELISDPEQLWSNHGIRSLSKQSEFYGTEENYWRSPIWMNMNYLIVSNLLNIATQPGPQQAKAKQMHRDLRLNLVETVYDNWKETGFAWEQYNPDTGKGQRTQHFTGWTSLVVKIMSMPDLDGKKGHDEL